MDLYFRENPSIIVTRDKDAIMAKRPLKYAEREEEEIRREQGSKAQSVVEIGSGRKS
jgi:hypothetical protein